MSDYVTREIIDTSARAEWESYAPTLDGGPWEDLTEAQRASWREGVGVVLTAAIPLVTPAIKAEALREAAEDWQSGAWAKTPRYADPVADRLSSAQFACGWIRDRADRIEREATR